MIYLWHTIFSWFKEWRNIPTSSPRHLCMVYLMRPHLISRGCIYVRAGAFCRLLGSTWEVEQKQKWKVSHCIQELQEDSSGWATVEKWVIPTLDISALHSTNFPLVGAFTLAHCVGVRYQLEKLSKKCSLWFSGIQVDKDLACTYHSSSDDCYHPVTTSSMPDNHSHQLDTLFCP